MDCVILTSRGNYAKFKRILELHPCEVVLGGELLLTEQSVPFGLEGRKVYFNLAGDTLNVMGRSVSLAINEFCSAFQEIKPDRVLLVGDRFETYAAATAAYFCGIEIVHLEGGEVSGSLDNKIRNAISELATVHFPCTKEAGRRLSRFDNVHVVGCTSLDIIETEFNGFDRLQGFSGSGPVLDTRKPYLVVIYHPDTSHYDRIKAEIQSLIKAVDYCKIPTFWLNANMDAGSGIVAHELRTYRDCERPSFIHFFKSLPIEHYGPLLANATCILGNSSSGIREASFFGTPNVCIGDRQKGREVAENTVFSNTESIDAMLAYQINNGRYEKSTLYGDGRASEKIICTLA